MSKKKALTGGAAVAEAMRQINPDVVAAYPITPQTLIMQTFAQFVADGDVDTEFIRVESEHSAMSACVGASASGARTMTATSANGLALMFEIVYIASSTRLPIVMPVVNRALSGPINIHCDHSDTMGCRDSGWIQLYCEDAQEAYENTILALRLAEHPDVLTPAMVCQDGFITSHCVEGVKVYDDMKIKGFVKEFKPKYSLLNTEKPHTIGPLDFYDYYFEHKRQQIEGMDNVKKVFKKVASEFSKITGKQHGFVEEYHVKDAEYIIITMSSTAGTARQVVDKLRKDGKKAGMLKIRMYRPFPDEEVVKALAGKKRVAVLDRAASIGNIGGPLFTDITSALYKSQNSENNPEVISYVFGLGGREITPNDIETVFDKLVSGKAKSITYLGVRE